MYFKQNVYFALENHENPIGMDVYTLDFPGSSTGKESACNAGDPGLISGFEDPLEKEMATRFNILAWRIPWTEEPGRLLSMESQELDMT